MKYAISPGLISWCRFTLTQNLVYDPGVVVFTTAQLHSSKPGLRFQAGSNPVHGLLDVCCCENF